MLLFLLAAGTLWAAPNKAYELFTIEPAGGCVKAGTVLTLKVRVRCKDGYALRGISACVPRRMAPAAFFDAAGVNVNRYYKDDPAKKSPYDSIFFFSELFKNPVMDGEFPVQINTAGMPQGDYALAIRGYFPKKGAKSEYLNIYYALTVSEGDNGKFAPTPQPQLETRAKK